MASLSEPVETFEDVLKKVEDFTCEGLINADRVKYIVSDMARRFKAAHECEVRRLRDCLKDATELYCFTCTDMDEETGKCKDKDGVCPPVKRWRDAFEGDAKGV